MRAWLRLGIVFGSGLLVFGLGCGESPPRASAFPSTNPAVFGPARPTTAEAASAESFAQAGREAEPVQRPEEKLPLDLGTRKFGEDWPAFLGPLGTSVSRETGIKPWPAAGPRIVWSKSLGDGYGMPSISRGRLFVFDRVGNSARLQCWNSETAAPLWKFEYETQYEDKYGYSNGPRCQPIVDGDRVYLLGSEGMLHCLKASTGEVLWKLDTARQFGIVQNFFGVGSTPIIEQDLLIVPVGGSPPGAELRDFSDLTGNGSGVVAFDKYTGQIRYKFSEELSSYASPVLATINGRRWGFVFARGGLIGFEPGTGREDFFFPWRARILESVNAANPVVVGDQVLISETYGVGSALLKVRPGHADVVWSDLDKGRNKSLLCHWNTPIHHAGYVYGSSGRHTGDAELRCVELATGKVMWSEPGLDRCTLLMIDGHFVCLGEYGKLGLLKVDPERYHEVSRAVLRDPNGVEIPGFGPRPLLPYPCWAAPIVSHGLMYLRGEGRLVCFELIPPG